MQWNVVPSHLNIKLYLLVKFRLKLVSHFYHNVQNILYTYIILELSFRASNIIVLHLGVYTMILQCKVLFVHPKVVLLIFILI